MDRNMRQAEREAKRAEREAAREERKIYNAAVREEIKEANLRHRAAVHLDWIEWQKKRCELTVTFFPGIAASHQYQEYVNRNINRNTRIYNRLMNLANRIGADVVVETPVQ